MCLGGGPSAPSAPALPPAPDPAPTPVDAKVVKARSQNAVRAALAGGRGADVLTSAQGLNDASSVTTGKKQALGI